jgi:uncharacterized protein YjdB
MAKTLKLTLKKSLIIEAAKADTYQTALIEKSDDPVRNAAKAYVMSAGDEKYHERKLVRLLRSGLAMFAAAMNEFVDSEAGSVTYNLQDEVDDIVVYVTVSDRYNSGLSQPLSSFAEDFIVYNIDFMWWQSLNSALAKDYMSYSQNTLTYIRLCLAKTAPKASNSSYADVTGEVVGGNVTSIMFPNDIYSATMGETFTSPQVSTSPLGLSLAYSSTNTEVATVDESTGEVTLVAAGSTTIIASFAGNDQYAPATGSYTLLVNPSE